MLASPVFDLLLGASEGRLCDSVDESSWFTDWLL
jgi:hypothetical protein